MSKQRFEHTTKSERIEWTVTKDKEKRETKAVWYVLKPEYHANPWTACAAIVTPQAEVINTYAFAMDREQTSAMQTALNMAVRFAGGKRLKGRKID